MTDAAIFPTGFYWLRISRPSIGLRDVEYAALWLFPTSNFRYIACWPGYSWFEASGTWCYGVGLIHCRGKSHSFTDDFSDNHDNRPYTTAFAPSADGQAVVTVGTSPQHYARLSPQQLGPLFTLDERTVPTRWQDFKKLMREIERANGLEKNEDESTSWISLCNAGHSVSIRHRPYRP